MKSRRWIRLTAIGAVVALAVLSLSICCSSAPIAAQQHGCCKGRCASVSATIPLVAVAQVRHRLPVLSLTAMPCTEASFGTAPSRAFAPKTARSGLFAPLTTIQLRI